MNQQINLFQPIFRRQKKVFSAVAMLQVCVFLMVVFSSIYLYGQVKLAPLDAELMKLDKDLTLLNGQLVQLEKKISSESKSNLLENELLRLSRELDKRREIQQLLSTQSFGNTRGFSGFLEALARQHVQGTWLTRIVIRNGGKQLGLDGNTLSSELVPAYISKLNKEDLMRGMAFNVMELARVETQTDQLKFHISTN